MRIRRALAAAGVTLVAAGCSGPPADSPAVVVFAAASLKKTFTAIGDDLTGLTVQTTFAGSADLLAQLTGGAQADVLATADTATMDKARTAGLLQGDPVSFATNRLTIVVAPGNPRGVKSFGDLPTVTVVVCAPQVPCGAALPGIAAAAGTPLNPVSEENSVTDVLGKVTAGQADAGVVYATDALAAGDRVSVVPFGEAAAAVNTYRIAVLAGATDPAGAARFVDAVTGTHGREILTAAGFGVP